jgi:hypothetical protein
MLGASSIISRKGKEEGKEEGKEALNKIEAKVAETVADLGKSAAEVLSLASIRDKSIEDFLDTVGLSKEEGQALKEAGYETVEDLRFACSRPRTT